MYACGRTRASRWFCITRETVIRSCAQNTCGMRVCEFGASLFFIGPKVTTFTTSHNPMGARQCHIHTPGNRLLQWTSSVSSYSNAKILQKLYFVILCRPPIECVRFVVLGNDYAWNVVGQIIMHNKSFPCRRTSTLRMTQSFTCVRRHRLTVHLCIRIPSFDKHKNKDIVWVNPDFSLSQNADVHSQIYAF
jgi:hypothetical protein